MFNSTCVELLCRIGAAGVPQVEFCNSLQWPKSGALAFPRTLTASLQTQMRHFQSKPVLRKV